MTQFPVRDWPTAAHTLAHLADTTIGENDEQNTLAWRRSSFYDAGRCRDRNGHSLQCDVRISDGCDNLAGGPNDHSESQLGYSGFHGDDAGTRPMADRRPGQWNRAGQSDGACEPDQSGCGNLQCSGDANGHRRRARHDSGHSGW